MAVLNRLSFFHIIPAFTAFGAKIEVILKSCSAKRTLGDYLSLTAIRTKNEIFAYSFMATQTFFYFIILSHLGVVIVYN